MKNVCLLGLLPFVLCSCASMKTSVEPGYDEDIFTIRSEHIAASSEYLLSAAKGRAAKESISRGMDCFILLDGTVNELKRADTKTMYGKFSDGSSFSYEIPTSPYYYGQPYASISVSFHDSDMCKFYEKAKQKVFYNNEAIRSATNMKIIYSAGEILAWGLLFSPILIVILLA